MSAYASRASLEREAVRDEAPTSSRLSRWPEERPAGCAARSSARTRWGSHALAPRSRIVSSRTVATRDDDLELLLVVGLARDLDRQQAHDGHARPVPRQLPRQSQRLCRRAEAVMTTESAPCPRDTPGPPQRRRRTRDGARDRTTGHRAIDLAAIDVDPDDVASVRRKKLDRDLADEPETDHDHHVSELRANEPHSLKCDRADRDERGFLVAYLVGHVHREVLRNGVHFGVVRVPCAGACHAIAASEPLDALSDVGDPPGERVAERNAESRASRARPRTPPACLLASPCRRPSSPSPAARAPSPRGSCAQGLRLRAPCPPRSRTRSCRRDGPRQVRVQARRRPIVSSPVR